MSNEVRAKTPASKKMALAPGVVAGWRATILVSLIFR